MGKRCVRILAVALALAWLGAGPAAASVYVANPTADAELEGVAPGLTLWLQTRLAEAGLGALRESSVLPPASGETLWARAEERGAEALLAPELRLREGRAELWLGVFAGAGDPIGAAREESSLADLGQACERAVTRLAPLLGLPASAPAPAAPPSLDELAATSRALNHADAGQLAAAWSEVAGRLTPLAMGLREEIVERTRDPRVEAVERARVLAASGDERAAWGLVAQRLADEERSATPDPEVLVAAGEVRLASGAPSGALAHFEAALARDPSRADAELGRARALAAGRDLAGARSAYLRAAELDPRDPRPLIELAELEGDPARQAGHLVEAGRRSAARLDVDRARRYLDRAIRLEPSAAAESWRATGDLERRLGRPRQAVALYARARQAGVGDVALFRNLGAAERALGELGRAEASFREALALRRDDAESLRGLAGVYVESGRPGQAIPLLERALGAAPADGAATRRDLARALHASGRSEEALGALEPARDSADALREAAAIQVSLGRGAEARASLDRAVALEPHAADLHARLAELERAEGDGAAATLESQRAGLLQGDAGDPAPAGEPLASSFDDLVATFGDGPSGAVAELGVRLAPGWRQQALEWLHPRRLDRRGLERALDAALETRFSLTHRPAIPADTLLEDAVDRLYDFASEASLGPESVAQVNQALGSGAVFAALARRIPPGRGEAQSGTCAGPDAVELEVRMLSGQQPGFVEILANGVCLAQGLELFGAWNLRALGIYGALLLGLFSPVLRGWGTVRVRIELPPRTRGFLSLRIARSPLSAEKKRRQRFAGLRRLLHSLSRYRRHMVGRETVFRWIPARRDPYYVTLMGPLKEAAGTEIIGHFLEEQRLRVARGKVAELGFDLQPRECALELNVLHGGAPAKQARVAVLGDPRSLRYAPGGRAFLYLGTGTHRVLIGAGDRVAESKVEVRSLERSIPLAIDLASPEGLLFEGCPEAVEPYLQGDFEGAAEVLARAGLAAAAQLARAEHHRRRGEGELAAEALEAAGRLEEAALLRVGSGGDSAASALLFERAGDHERAARAWREAGDPARAARAFEAAYDFDSALECYREVGDVDKEMELLERTGQYLDAAELARKRGDADRAVRSLQQIARNDSSWGDGCALLGEILAERGDREVAVETFEEALRVAGGEQASAEILERYARLLESCDEREKALKAWSAVSRRDPSREDVPARISMLRQELARRPPGPAADAPAGSAESRYERIGELGRGGMGVVYKARDRRLGRLVALKELPPNLRQHPEAVKLFLREARSAASLNHRNIVTVHDAGEENGTFYITMELLEGLPLDRILARRGRLSPRDTARLGLQVAAGLDYAHCRRIVHRDIKTGNLFFTRDKLVKIMDFGLAKTIEQVRGASTLLGGTPFYMAPEQAAGEAVDHRADLYAFGVTLFKLATGSLPFPEGDATYQHRHTPPPDPRELEAGIPEALAALILGLLGKRPEERPASAAEVTSRLEQILGSSPG